MRGLGAILVVGCLNAVVCVDALAAEASLALCTAGSQGVYFVSGREIAEHANPKYLKVTVLETNGSMDNMQRMANRECGAAIVQSDAYLVYQARHRDRPVEVTRNRFLYAEFVHLVCRRDAGVATTGEMLANPGRHRILVGAEESGSALTWQAFTLLDRRYGQLAAEHIGGETALQRVLSDQAQCLFFVSGLGSSFAKEVNRRGSDLRLVPITDDVFRNAEFGSVTLYETRHFPKAYYSNLEAGFSDAVVETLTVGATLVIDRHWSDRYANGPSALLGAVGGAMPAINKRAMAGFK